LNIQVNPFDDNLQSSLAKTENSVF